MILQKNTRIDVTLQKSNVHQDGNRHGRELH